jgi:hypothetical protein
MASVDQIARDGVAKAISMIEAHERVCAERAKESDTWRLLIIGKLDEFFNTVNGKLIELTDQVGKIYGHMWVAVGAIIAALFATIGYLISHHGL